MGWGGGGQKGMMTSEQSVHVLTCKVRRSSRYRSYVLEVFELDVLDTEILSPTPVTNS